MQIRHISASIHYSWHVIQAQLYHFLKMNLSLWVEGFPCNSANKARLAVRSPAGVTNPHLVVHMVYKSPLITTPLTSKLVNRHLWTKSSVKNPVGASGQSKEIVIVFVVHSTEEIRKLFLVLYGTPFVWPALPILITVGDNLFVFLFCHFSFYKLIADVVGWVYRWDVRVLLHLKLGWLSFYGRYTSKMSQFLYT